MDNFNQCNKRVIRLGTVFDLLFSPIMLNYQIMNIQMEKEYHQILTRQDCLCRIEQQLQKIVLVTTGKPYPQKLDQVVRRRRKVILGKKGVGIGKWTLEEQKIYISFLQMHIEDMNIRLARKSKKVFIQMSNQIITRSANQCRSHHQKLLKYHYSVEKIVHYYQKEVFPYQEDNTNKIKKERLPDTLDRATLSLGHMGFALEQNNGLMKIEIDQKKIDVM